jgi:asparagine synthase (glutamine-hydrolysing)
MCGIVGIVRRGAPEPGDEGLVRRMSDALRHRGPDGDGVLTLGAATLGHRRLAIVDLTPAGAQPMVPRPDEGAEGAARVAITYNGEVYNHADLRAELEELGYRFGSRSDTEVVLQGWRAWGERLPERLNGMFAIAVWDADRETLLLARDRYGEKPLFWRRLERGGIAFASEARALLLLPEQGRGMEPSAVAKYLAFDCFPGDSAALPGVKKLRPGHALVWKGGEAQVRRYWERRYGGSGLTDEEAEDRLWELLVTAVERRLMADVPLGVFLSGGIDSSAVLAAMAERVDPARIDAFTIAFDEPGFDESPWARTVARHFGVRHHQRTMTMDALLACLPEVLDPLDEPLADASLVPTYALSKLARERVTVALGGDGGDELFAGYDTFVAERLARPYLRLPGLARRGVAALVDALPPSRGKMSLQFRAARFVRGLDPDPLVRNQRWFGSFLPEEAAMLVRGGPPPDEVYEDLRALRPAEGEQASLELWTGIYLPDDVLTKVDRASMTVSLEVRAPFLDPDLAAFAHALPFHMKLRGLTRKWILKRALRHSLPHDVLHRRKQGFGPPYGDWLRGPLRREVEQLLAPDRVDRAGLLDPLLVSRMVVDHLDGTRDLRKQVWALYVLARWCARLGVW